MAIVNAEAAFGKLDATEQVITARLPRSESGR